MNHRLVAAERRAALDAERRAAWQRLLDEDAAAEDRDAHASAGTVSVRAHLRDGHPVGAYTRSPPRPGAP